MPAGVIIANQGAGTFSQQTLDAACRQLADAGLAVEQLRCSDFAAMTETAARISREPHAPLIIAAGGDGTINAVFNGLAGNNATCAILPLGTANVLAIELGLKTPQAAIMKIIAGSSRPFTAGVISSGRRSNRFFLMAGAGFDGAVVRGVTPAMKKRLGKGAYLLSALRSLAAWEQGELQITTAERQFTCHSIIACNAAHYGGSFTLAPAASLFAPTLELVAVTHQGRSGVLSLAAAVAGKRHDDSIVRFQATQLLISGTKPLQVDGDDWGDAPVEIRAESNFARIMV